MLLLRLLVRVDLRTCMHSSHPLLVKVIARQQTDLVALLLRRMVQVLQSGRVLDHAAHRRRLQTVLGQELLGLEGTVCGNFQLGVHVLQLLLLCLCLHLLELDRGAVLGVEVGLRALHALHLILLLLL